MILDEIQACFGSTGKLSFPLNTYQVVQDILVMGKVMPIGAFIQCLTHNPMFEHYFTTIHSVIASDALEALNELIENSWMNQIEEKILIRQLLVHTEIKAYTWQKIDAQLRTSKQNL